MPTERSEIFGQVVPQTWASHTEQSFGKCGVTAWYSRVRQLDIRMITVSVEQSWPQAGSRQWGNQVLTLTMPDASESTACSNMRWRTGNQWSCLNTGYYNNEAVAAPVCYKLRRSFVVTKRRHSINFWNRKNSKYTFCKELNFEHTIHRHAQWRHEGVSRPSYETAECTDNKVRICLIVFVSVSSQKSKSSRSTKNALAVLTADTDKTAFKAQNSINHT